MSRATWVRSCLVFATVCQALAAGDPDHPPCVGASSDHCSVGEVADANAGGHLADATISLLQVHAERSDRPASRPAVHSSLAQQDGKQPWIQQMLHNAKEAIMVKVKPSKEHQEAPSSPRVSAVVAEATAPALARTGDGGGASNFVNASGASAALSAKATEVSSVAAQEIARDIGRLRESLSGHQLEEERAAHREKAEYVEKLAAQAREADAEARQNAKLTTQVASVEKNNAKLRAHADVLRKDCDKLKANLKSLQADLATAEDFAGETLERANDSGAAELTVLDELAAEEKEQVSAKAHRNRLEAIERLSMLALDSAPSDPHGAAPDLLKNLSTNLEVVAKSRVETEEHMKATFLARYKKNAAKLEELGKEREALEQLLEAKETLHTRLLAALHALGDEREKLVTQSKQAAAFWRRLGAGAA